MDQESVRKAMTTVACGYAQSQRICGDLCKLYLCGKSDRYWVGVGKEINLAYDEPMYEQSLYLAITGNHSPEATTKK